MDTVLTFIQNRTKMLCEIYQKEKQARYDAGADDDGVLAITLDGNDIKVAFLDEVTLMTLNPEIYDEMRNLINQRTCNGEIDAEMDFFYAAVGGESKLIELNVSAFLG